MDHCDPFPSGMLLDTIIDGEAPTDALNNQSPTDAAGLKIKQKAKRYLNSVRVSPRRCILH